MSNGQLDVLAVVRLVLDAVDQVVESDSRKTGSVESQRAAALARRARVALDQLGMQALREVG
jgi:hypothetical protein